MKLFGNIGWAIIQDNCFVCLGVMCPSIGCAFIKHLVQNFLGELGTIEFKCNLGCFYYGLFNKLIGLKLENQKLVSREKGGSCEWVVCTWLTIDCARVEISWGSGFNVLNWGSTSNIEMDRSPCFFLLGITRLWRILAGWTEVCLESCSATICLNFSIKKKRKKIWPNWG